MEEELLIRIVKLLEGIRAIGMYCAILFTFYYSFSLLIKTQSRRTNRCKHLS